MTRQTTYSYNLAGWRSGETWVSGSYAATYSYNAGGQLTGASDPNSVYTYSYDSDGRVSQSKVSYPAITALGTVTLSYAYDGLVNRTSLTDSTGGTYCNSYNVNHQFTAIGLTVSGQTSPSIGFSYDSSDRLSNIARTVSGGPNNTITTTFTYDNANRVTKISHGFNGTNLGTFSYTYNAASEITNYSGPDGSLTYTYDNAGQLTGVSGAHNESFGFDNNGNRNTTGYTITTGNRMTADAAGNTLTYDHAGNLATKTDSSGNVWTYTFDFHNRLTQVVEKNSGGTTILTENLTYDVNDNLISTSVNGTVQRWTVFDGKNPLLDFNASGTLTQRFLADPTVLDRVFASVSASGTIAWLLGDNLGSTRVVTDVSGNVLDQITYGAFGNILSQTNSANAPRFLYAGGEWDGNLGLYHFDARWTDPVDGRWISQDPLGLGPDSNPYRYVANSPTNFIDPQGTSLSLAMNPEAAAWALGTLAGGYLVGVGLGNLPPVNLAPLYGGWGAQPVTTPIQTLPLPGHVSTPIIIIETPLTPVDRWTLPPTSITIPDSVRPPLDVSPYPINVPNFPPLGSPIGNGTILAILGGGIYVALTHQEWLQQKEAFEDAIADLQQEIKEKLAEAVGHGQNIVDKSLQYLKELMKQLGDWLKKEPPPAPPPGPPAAPAQ
jgi:RHS repeat-associated protein